MLNYLVTTSRSVCYRLTNLSMFTQHQPQSNYDTKYDEKQHYTNSRVKHITLTIVLIICFLNNDPMAGFSMCIHACVHQATFLKDSRLSSLAIVAPQKQCRALSINWKNTRLDFVHKKVLQCEAINSQWCATELVIPETGILWICVF